MGGATFSLSDRPLSAYINALAKAGFSIEQMVEQTDSDLIRGDTSDFAQKAGMLPVTFVFKARKR